MAASKAKSKAISGKRKAAAKTKAVKFLTKPGLFWSSNKRPEDVLHLGCNYVAAYGYTRNDVLKKGFHHVAANTEADTFSGHNLCLTHGGHGMVIHLDKVDLSTVYDSISDNDLKARLGMYFPDLECKYHDKLPDGIKKVKHADFLVTVYYKHGRGLGYTFYTYLDLMCCAVEKINKMMRPAFLFPGAEVTPEMVEQYAGRTAIKKIRLHRVRKGKLSGRLILKEIVFAVNKSGVPIRRRRKIVLAGDPLKGKESFLIPDPHSQA